MHTMAPLTGHPPFSSECFEELVALVKDEAIIPLHKQYLDDFYLMDGGIPDHGCVMTAFWQLSFPLWLPAPDMLQGSCSTTL